MSGIMTSEVWHSPPGGMLASTLVWEWVVTRVVLMLVAGSPVELCIEMCTLVASETGLATTTGQKNYAVRGLPRCP